VFPGRPYLVMAASRRCEGGGGPGGWLPRLGPAGPVQTCQQRGGSPVMGWMGAAGGAVGAGASRGRLWVTMPR
jgi:hypothetical protein